MKKFCGIVDYLILVDNCVNRFEEKQQHRKEILNGCVEINDNFVFRRQYRWFANPIMVLKVLRFVR